MIYHSIIVPTAGRPEAVKSVIPTLLRLPLKALSAEVIVVDNNSDDDVSAEIQCYCELFADDVRYARALSPGLTAARHAGAAKARGELLTFIDDDVEVSVGWLAAIQKAFNETDVAMVGGPSIPRFTGPVPAWFWDFVQPYSSTGWYCGWLSLLDLGTDVPEVDPDMVWGLNFSLRKNVLDACGGFHPDSVPSQLQRWQGDGESGLTKKVKSAGYRAYYCQNALLYHFCGPDRLNVEYFKKRAFFQGVCDSYTSIRRGHNPVYFDPQHSCATGDWQLRAVMGRVQRTFNGLRPKKNSSTWSGAAQRVRKLTDQAYRDGWTFHQREVGSDQHLLAWVRRETYMDADIQEELVRYRPNTKVIVRLGLDRIKPRSDQH
jgi:glycosyltransferase involved in cell wall biosynthesis